jgi:hypothetical protein
MRNIFLLCSFSISAQFMQKEASLFIENNGQIVDQNLKNRSDVKYAFVFENKCVFFKPTGASYQISKLNSNKFISYRVDLDFLGANQIVSINNNKNFLTNLNYYNNENGKLIEAKTCEELFYKNLYHSIDLKYYFKNGDLKYDFEIAPNSDYKKIKIRIRGSKKTYIDKKGDLIIVTPFGNIIENRPVVIQNNQILKANWVLQNDVLSFNIENVNPKYKLIIDPLVRLWGTYSGGSGQDVIYYSKTDNSNNLYVSGYTNSTSNIATIGAFQNTFGGQSSQVWGDAFVTKYNSAGTKIWSTYYGGNNSDFGSMINIDASGNVYLVGASLSTNTAAISTTGSHQSNYGGGSNTGDAFIVKFDSNGLRLWGTYYGGTGDDYADGAILDNSGNLYVTGVTSSTVSNVISTLGSFQQNYGGGSNDAFLVKFDSNGNRIWGTYYGGSGIDNGLGCNFDGFGNILICGYTTSTNNISTLGAHQTTFSGGAVFGDGFFAQFNATGNRLYGSYYGGLGEDYIGNVVSNTLGEVIISGSSSTNTGTSIATFGSYQPIHGGGSYDLFMAKFNSSFVRQWGTYYGGAGNDEMGYCAVNNTGIFISGRTTNASQSVLTTSCSYQANYGGGFTDACLAKFDFTGNRIWSTLYGGTGTEDSPSICTDQLIYLTGGTNSNIGNVMASPSSQQFIYGGGASDGFIAKFDGCQQIPPPNTTNPSNMQVCYNNTTTLSTSVNCGIFWYNVPSGGTPIYSGSTFTTNNITSNITYYIEETTCGSSTRTAVQLTVVPNPTISCNITPSVICSGQSVTLTMNGANTYSLNNIQLPLNTVVITPSLTTTYTVSGSNSNNCSNSTIITVSVNPCTSIYDNTLFTPIINYIPCNNYIEIITPNLSAFKVKILSLSGQTVYENIFNNNLVKISLEDLASGLYILQINSQLNHSFYSSKLIKP